MKSRITALAACAGALTLIAAPVAAAGGSDAVASKAVPKKCQKLKGAKRAKCIKASAPSHTIREAEQVIKAEIADRYPVLYGDVSLYEPVTLDATCSALNNVLFKCDWTATSTSTRSFGKAKVTFYAKGNEAAFSDVSCGKNYDNPDDAATDLAVELACDEDPHNG